MNVVSTPCLDREAPARPGQAGARAAVTWRFAQVGRGDRPHFSEAVERDVVLPIGVSAIASLAIWNRLCYMGPRRRPKGTRGAGQFAPNPAPPQPDVSNLKLSPKPNAATETPSLLRDAVQDAAGGKADRYLDELIKEVGQPCPEAVAEAKALWSRIERARAIG